MTDALDAHAHELAEDPADGLMACIVDAHKALEALADAARNIQCPGCDPTGEICEQTRLDMLENFDVDCIDADMLLAHAADVRGVLMGVLMPPCHHSHDEQHDGEE